MEDFLIGYSSARLLLRVRAIADRSRVLTVLDIQSHPQALHASHFRQHPFLGQRPMPREDPIFRIQETTAAFHRHVQKSTNSQLPSRPIRINRYQSPNFRLGDYRYQIGPAR